MCMHTDSLLSKYPIITDQVEKTELEVLLKSLETVLQKNVQGSVIEFGCYAGTTSLFIQRLLQLYNPVRGFHVYDSFAGLPEKLAADQSPIGTQFQPGELAVTKSVFIRNFKKAGLVLPKIHKGWFEDLTPDEIPTQIAFAFLDGDYYQSIMSPLKLLGERLSPGAIVVVDDYQNEALPGASKAVDDWLKTHRVTRFRVQQSLAILTI